MGYEGYSDQAVGQGFVDNKLSEYMIADLKECTEKQTEIIPRRHDLHVMCIGKPTPTSVW
jgi:hypothetical protein